MVTENTQKHPEFYSKILSHTPRLNFIFLNINNCEHKPEMVKMVTENTQKHPKTPAAY
jgi:hypothetical protein